MIAPLLRGEDIVGTLVVRRRSRRFSGQPLRMSVEISMSNASRAEHF